MKDIDVCSESCKLDISYSFALIRLLSPEANIECEASLKTQNGGEVRGKDPPLAAKLDVSKAVQSMS